jgi:hypothetical protein
MEYKGIEYTVVQTASPTGWKWTVLVDATRRKTGDVYSRATAVSTAEHVIDKIVKALSRAK